jgi:hypothetical protein
VSSKPTANRHYVQSSGSLHATSVARRTGGSVR